MTRLVWKSSVNRHRGGGGGWVEEATFPDGRVATLAIGLGHRWVLVVDGSRVGTFGSQDRAIARAERLAVAS